jgi:hypothetical protein
MTDVATIDIIGAWIGIFLTMCILSFLYGDNPFYKLGEHLFIGVSIGYIVVVQFRNNFYVKFDRELTAWDLVPAALVAMMFVKLASKRLIWLGRFPLAFVIALYAGQSVTGLVGSDLGDQIKTASRSLVVYKVDLQTADAHALSTVPGVSPAIATKLVESRQDQPFKSVDDALTRSNLTPSERDDLADERGVLVGTDARATVDGSNQIDWFGVASQVLLLVALLTGLLYFYFSIAHKGAIGRVSRVGAWILMIGFGASFGYTVQGRIALAIARAQDIRGKFMSPHDAAQIHGEVAAIVSIVIIIAGIWFFGCYEKRRRAGATPLAEAS